MSKKNDLEHTSTTLGSQNMKSSQRMVSVVEPYELPEGWKWCRLPECVSIVTGKKDANYGTPDGKYLFFTCAEQPLRCDDYSFEGESLLLPGNGANVGQVIYYDGQFEVYQRTYVLQKTNESILLKYLYYHILGFWKNYNLDKQYGSATNYIKMGNFLNYHFPLPPTLVEQQRIVNRIESMFAKLDEAKEKAQNVVDGFETRKAAILHKAFTGELTANWRKENGVSDDSWVEKTIGECGKWERGRSKHRPRNAPELFGGKYPFIQTGDIANADIYIYEHKQTLSEFGFQQSRLFPKDTLCITIAANIGKVAILTYDCCFPDSVVGFTPFTDVDSKFMYFAISNIEKDLDSMAPATAQKNLNLKLLTAVKIKLPIFAEQQEIVHILDTILEKESRAKEAAQTVLAQIALLKKSILARAFRGKI